MSEHTHRWGHLRGKPNRCLDCSTPYIEGVNNN